MAKKSAIIIFPHLNDCGGDLSKDWYVEYKWRIPGETKLRKERIYKGIYSGDEQSRRKEAAKIIQAKTKWMQKGGHLQGSERKVYADELVYRQEAKMYGKMQEHVVTTRTNLSQFLSLVKQKVNAKSFGTYQSKIRIFNSWLAAQKLSETNIKNIDRNHILNFAVYLSEEEKLSKLTIDKYIQILHAFFEYELDNGRIEKNPVVKIPKMGKTVDFSAVPFRKSERELLKKAIEKTDPQLWLACQIQYYCAIRPGTELRLIKIGWFDFESCKLRVPSEQAKNNKTEIVSIPDFLMKEIKAMQLHLFDKDLYVFGVFGRPAKEPVGKNTLRNRFNRFRDALNISPDRKFYSWKHTGAIQLINNGAKPYDLMNHLRHKSFDTTQMYLRKMGGDYESKISEFTTEI